MYEHAHEHGSKQHHHPPQCTMDGLFYREGWHLPGEQSHGAPQVQASAQQNDSSAL